MISVSCRFLIRIALVFSFILPVSFTPAFAACKDIENSKAYSKKREGAKFLVEGMDGFLFISQKDLQQDFPLSKRNLNFAALFRARMKAKGIDVVFTIPPTRGMVHQDKIPQAAKEKYGFDPVLARRNFQGMIDKLRAKGFVVATLPDLDMPDYAHKQDHHWSADGARAVAKDVANQIAQSGFGAESPKTAFQTAQIKTNPPFEGALATSYRDVCGVPVKPQKITEYVTTRLKGEESTSESDLFGEESAPPIVLVGTSFSSNDVSHANFDGFLREFTSMDVENLAVRGGGFSSGVLLYLDSPDFKEKRNAILVWEMPAYLKFGVRSDWREISAAPQGDCKSTKDLALETDFVAGKTPVPLFGDAALRSLYAAGKKDEYYLVFTFPDDPESRLILTGKPKKGKAWDQKVEHADRIGKNLPYYVDLTDEGPMESLTLQENPKLGELKGTVRLCRFPKKEGP